MKTKSRILWLATLLFFVSGCSGYRVVCYTRDEVPGEPAFNEQETCQIDRGDDVVITLVGGQSAKGTVESISADEIVLSDEYDFSESQFFHINEVQTIERYGTSGSADDTIAIVVGSVIVIGSVAVYAATASLRDGILSN